MASSESYSLNTTRAKIMNLGARKVFLGRGESLSASETSELSELLNIVVKGLENVMAKSWVKQWKVATLTASAVVTASSSTYRCIKGHTSSTATEPTTGANWTEFWVEDTGATSGGAWADVTAYNCAGDFALPTGVLGIDKAFYRGTSGVDTPIDIVTLSEYLDINNKYHEANSPSAITVDDRISSTVYIYPQPNDMTVTIHYLANGMLEVFDNPSDSPDFPDRWIDFLSYRLASRICDEEGDERGAKYWNISEALLKEVKTGEGQSLQTLPFVVGAFE